MRPSGCRFSPTASVPRRSRTATCAGTSHTPLGRGRGWRAPRSRSRTGNAGYPGEWQLHHQGRTTGYGSREVIATPSTLDCIEVGQSFAWNPSITGAKCEETFVVTAEGAELVTCLPSAVAS